MKIIIPRNRTKDSEIKHLLDTYDKVYKHFELANDNYFKRTQIIMIAIQIVLFTGFVKLVSDIPSLCTQKLVLLLSISVIGLFFACAWILYIKRQRNLLEFCRCYMRYIEKKLLNYNVPLAIFNAESVIFHLNSEAKCTNYSINFTDDLNNRNSSDSNVGDNSEDKSCLQTKFPYDRKETKISGLMGIEKDMACFILLIWFACFTAILSIHWNILPCPLRCIFIAIFIGVFIYWIWLRDLKKKRKKKYEKEINFWDLKKDSF